MARELIERFGSKQLIPRFGWLFALSLLFVAGRARADDVDRFEQLMTEGHARFERGDYVGALAEFREAEPLFACPTAPLWAGKSLEALGRFAEASEAYEHAEQATLPADAPDLCREAQENARTRRSELPPASGHADEVKGEPPASSAAGASSASDAPHSHARRTWSWIAFAVGGTGIAVGATTGALVLKDMNTVHADCDDGERPTCKHQSGLDALDRANSLATVSTVAFSIGAAGLVTGLVLRLTEPHQREAATARARSMTWRPVIVAARGGGLAGFQSSW